MRRTVWNIICRCKKMWAKNKMNWCSAQDGTRAHSSGRRDKKPISFPMDRFGGRRGGKGESVCPHTEIQLILHFAALWGYLWYILYRGCSVLLCVPDLNDKYLFIAYGTRRFPLLPQIKNDGVFACTELLLCHHKTIFGWPW